MCVYAEVERQEIQCRFLGSLDGSYICVYRESKVIMSDLISDHLRIVKF